MPRIAKKGPRPAPWSVRGVTAEARNAAIAAAHREGQTLGEWLDRAIRQNIKAERAGELAPTLETTLAELVKTMQAQNARLEAVEGPPRLFGALWPQARLKRIHEALERPVGAF